TDKIPGAFYAGPDHRHADLEYNDRASFLFEYRIYEYRADSVRYKNRHSDFITVVPVERQNDCFHADSEHTADLWYTVYRRGLPDVYGSFFQQLVFKCGSRRYRTADHRCR